MAICPNCHRTDKNFFAPYCHSCNAYTGFWEQCAHSLLWTIVPLIFWVVFYVVIISLIF